MRVPDAFSFPSGHTPHAVAFAALVSPSRVARGLHDPSDARAGALLGSGTAALVRWLA